VFYKYAFSKQEGFSSQEEEIYFKTILLSLNKIGKEIKTITCKEVKICEEIKRGKNEKEISEELYKKLRELSETKEMMLKEQRC